MAAKSGQPVSCFSRLCQSPEEGKMSFVEDLIDACRCLRPVDNSEDLYRLSVRVHATATPVQAVDVRTERTIVNEQAKRRCVSPAPREFARNWDTRRLWLFSFFL